MGRRRIRTLIDGTLTIKWGIMWGNSTIYYLFPIYLRLSDCETTCGTVSSLQVFGRRPVFIGSLLIFALGSALGGSAQNMNWLVAARGMLSYYSWWTGWNELLYLDVHAQLFLESVPVDSFRSLPSSSQIWFPYKKEGLILPCCHC